MPLEVDWEACRAQVDYPRTLSLFRELEFASLIKRLPAGAERAGAESVKPSGEQPDAGGGQLSMFADADLQSPIADRPDPRSPRLACR